MQDRSLEILDVDKQQLRLKQWERWIPAIHWTGTLSAIGVGMGVFIFTPMLLGQQAWYWLHLATFKVPELTYLISPTPAPSITIALIYSACGVAIAMSAVTLTHWVSPLTKRLPKNRRKRVKRLPRNSAAQIFVTQLSRENNLRPAKVFQSDTEAVEAFAASAPFRRSIIVVSRGLLESVDKKIAQWVLAHEVAHLVHGDTKRSGPWIVAINTFMAIDRVRCTVTRIILRAVSAIPPINQVLIPLIGRPVMWVSHLIRWITNIGFRTSTFIYRVFDRWVSRQCEYRADQFAAFSVGPQYGIHLMEILAGGFEPNLDLLNTHPSPRKRAKALRALIQPQGGESKQQERN